ncbi:anaerobic ribonucleoside-triphosphate reductase activating protein, partial [Candidatus Bipolaricaulota bacterium]|nr:anaerobic ribonucleoside-triphosphate reductase activating protein [Candidatus Bipolaricaulota bacterium]
AGVLFTVGCNFRCPFCHNPELVLPGRSAGLSLIEPEGVLETLRDRRTFLDGATITGGEPTLHDGLIAFVREVKRLGLLVKLDTNGSNPELLNELLEEQFADYIAMDIKASAQSYQRLAGARVDLAVIERSIGLIREKAPDYEFRTTVAPTLDEAEIAAIAEWIGGAKRYTLQRFRAPSEKSLVDPAWASRGALSEQELEAVWMRIRGRFDDGGVRA